MNKIFIRKVFLALTLLLSVFTLGGCSSLKVQTVDDEIVANQIMDVLREHGINATKGDREDGEKKTFEITVDSQEEYGAAIQLMGDHCLPQKLPPKIETSGLVSSLEVETAQQLRRTKIDIESQLRNLPGTTCVDLTIVMPEDRSINLNPYGASATVHLKHKTEKFGSSKADIASMVAGGVPGLSPNNVVVTVTKQPLRPLPDFTHGRNMRRILYIGIIGVSTILLFVGLVVVLRTRRKKGDEEVEDETDDDLLENETETELLDNESVTDTNNLNN